jgi:hypothetical protein
VTGMVILIVSTTFTAGLISSAVNSATGAVKSVASVAAGAVGGAATATGGAVAENGDLAGTLQALGLGDAYQAVTSGLNDAELNQIIADASPELNQTQVAAATGVIRVIVTTSSRDLGTALQNPSDLPNFVSNRVDSISKALSGDQFISRLQRRGLSKAQAREVSNVIGKRVATLRSQAASEQVQQVARDAASTAGKAAWVWLLLAGLVLGLAATPAQTVVSNTLDWMKLAEPIVRKTAFKYLLFKFDGTSVKLKPTNLRADSVSHAEFWSSAVFGRTEECSREILNSQEIVQPQIFS